MPERTDFSAAVSRRYDLHGLTVKVTAPDVKLARCLDAFLAPLAVESDGSCQWNVSIRVIEHPPAAPPGQTVWEGNLPEGLPAVIRRDGADRNLLVHDHLAFRADSRRRQIDVSVRRGSERALFGTAGTNILGEVIRGSGRFLLHAACLVHPDVDECLLIFAPSGMGKTTTSLALARQGWRLGGDDAAILKIVRNEPQVFALPRAPTIHRRTADLLPWLASVTPTWHADEQAVALSDVVRLVASAAPVPRRCRTIVLLDRPNDNAHAIAHPDRSSALLRILADNLRIGPDGLADQDVSLLDALAVLVKHADVLQVSAGRELATLASTLAEHVRRAGSPRGPHDASRISASR
jgi:hypothetical protein